MAGCLRWRLASLEDVGGRRGRGRKIGRGWSPPLAPTPILPPHPFPWPLSLPPLLHTVTLTIWNFDFFFFKKCASLANAFFNVACEWIVSCFTPSVFQLMDIIMFLIVFYFLFFFFFSLLGWVGVREGRKTGILQVLFSSSALCDNLWIILLCLRVCSSAAARLF